MTAVIGIFNKSGIALAADSAVTINVGNGKKIYNNAYKIFTLSKYHPVSVMIYNSAQFMGIPWEIIIKEYRKKLGMQSFDTLQQYVDDFIRYLKSYLNYINENEQLRKLDFLIQSTFKKIIFEVIDSNLIEIKRRRSNREKKQFILNKLNEYLDSAIQSNKQREITKEFQNFTFSIFIKKYQQVLEKNYDDYFSELNLSSNEKNKLFNIIFQAIIRDVYYGQWSGLVITGFGNKEIFPRCFPLKIGEVFDNKIKYSLDKKNIVIIDDKLNAAIRPFAQRDVIDTILSGIDSVLEYRILKSFENFLENFLELLKNEINDSEEIRAKLDRININKLLLSFVKDFHLSKRETHIDPLMFSISTLSKEDLAELAESLIYLTYLKRRMSFSEESVGGPIDVAILTKGDGFVWIKRKHYFKKELNQNYIYKYFKDLQS